jgi:transposase
MGALSMAPWALRLGCYFRFYDHNIMAEEVVGFLRMLHRQLRRPLIVVLDRWGVHRKALRLLQVQRAPWLQQIEWLRAYAPELNPVEQLWNHTKWGDLANFIPDNAQHLRQVAQQSLRQQQSNPRRLYSCFQAAKLE